MQENIDIRELNEKIQRESSFVDMLNMEMNKVIVGQKAMVERLLIGIALERAYIIRRCAGSCKNLSH